MQYNPLSQEGEKSASSAINAVSKILDKNSYLNIIESSINNRINQTLSNGNCQIDLRL